MGGKWVTVGLTVTFPPGPPQAPPQAGSSAPPNCWPSEETPGPQPSHSPFTQVQERPRGDHKPSSGRRSGRGSGRRPASSHG